MNGMPGELLTQQAPPRLSPRSRRGGLPAASPDTMPVEASRGEGPAGSLAAEAGEMTKQIGMWILEALLDQKEVDDELFFRFVDELSPSNRESTSFADKIEGLSNAHQMRYLLRKIAMYGKGGKLDLKDFPGEVALDYYVGVEPTDEPEPDVRFPIHDIDFEITFSEDAVRLLQKIYKVANCMKEDEAVLMIPTVKLIEQVYICACMSYIQRGKSEKENFSLEDIKMAGVAACRLLDLFKADCQPVYTHLCKTAESLCDAIVPAAKDKWLSLTPSIEKLDTDDYERIGKVLEEKDSEIASKLLQTYCSDAMNVGGKSFLMKVSEELKRKTFPSKQGDKQKAILTARARARKSIALPDPAEVANLRESGKNLSGAAHQVEDPLDASIAFASTANHQDIDQKLETPRKRARVEEGTSIDGLEITSPIEVTTNAFKAPVIPKHAVEDLSEYQLQEMKSRQKGRPKGQGKGLMWTEEEEYVLKQKVKELYDGTKTRMPWKAIKEAAGPALERRTQVDLKDKWRNMNPKKSAKRTYITLKTEEDEVEEDKDDEEV